MGAIIKFEYVIPSIANELVGVLPLIEGVLPVIEGFKIGVISIDALNRKVHLATLPIVFNGAIEKRMDFYPVQEPLSEGHFLNGTFMDQTSEDADFHPYRIKVILKTSA